MHNDVCWVTIKQVVWLAHLNTDRTTCTKQISQDALAEGEQQ